MNFKRIACFYVPRNTFPNSQSIKQININWSWNFNFLQMQNRATDRNFSPGEATSLGFILEASTVGESKRGSSADLKLSEQEHFLCYSEAENA